MSEVYIVVEDGGRITTLFERQEDASRYLSLSGFDEHDYEVATVLDAAAAADVCEDIRAMNAEDDEIEDRDRRVNITIAFDPEDQRFSIYEDVSGLFWPDDSRSNHDAEEKITDRMEKHGCQRIPVRFGFGMQTLTRAIVSFDSESGGFSCSSRTREALEYVVEIIRELVAEFDAAREVLR